MNFFLTISSILAKVKYYLTDIGVFALIGLVLFHYFYLIFRDIKLSFGAAMVLPAMVIAGAILTGGHPADYILIHYERALSTLPALQIFLSFAFAAFVSEKLTRKSKLHMEEEKAWKAGSVLKARS
jgi:hypothetical protein